MMRAEVLSICSKSQSFSFMQRFLLNFTKRRIIVKKRYLCYSALAVFLLVATSSAWVGICPSLPSSAVTPTVTKPGPNSYFDIMFTDIVGVFDVANNIHYLGWCVDPWGDSGDMNKAYLYCTAGSLPSEALGIPWDKINYLLNHKIVHDPITQADVMGIQYALWNLVAGDIVITHPDWWTADAQDMYADANANGSGFTPGPNQVVGVLLVPTEGYTISPYDLGTAQEMMIELVVPEYGAEGCTPGFWKNHTGAGVWPAPYLTSSKFETVFGVSVGNPSLTLIQALNWGGGGFAMIARHGTAALLSAAHGDVDYPYSVAQVIYTVKDAIAGVKGAIDALVTANELGCPINGK
jgi:hypothetical protein